MSHSFPTNKRQGKKLSETNHRLGLQKRTLKLVQEPASQDPIGASKEVVGSLSVEIFKIWLDKGLSNLL